MQEPHTWREWSAEKPCHPVTDGSSLGEAGRQLGSQEHSEAAAGGCEPHQEVLLMGGFSKASPSFSQPLFCQAHYPI